MDKITTVRTGGITFAPEAGTQRLRDVINKNINEEETAPRLPRRFEGGKTAVNSTSCRTSTETDEDLDGIIALAREVIEEFYRTPGRVKRQPQVTISAACFVPKPFTPFQWEASARTTSHPPPEIRHGEKHRQKVKYNYHDGGVSRIEAVFAPGDRRLCKALLEAHRRGMRLDAWEEYFSYEAWLDVFRSSASTRAFTPTARSKRTKFSRGT